MNILLLFLGFIFLIKGADLFVYGASSIAKKFNIPSMIIGLTIVAMGTSLPEASVSITSSLSGQNDMSVANVVGSNFFNILIVLGVCSLINPLPIESNTLKKDTPFLLFISFLLLIFGFDLSISRVEGILFLIVFSLFLINMIKISNEKSSNLLDTNEIKSENFINTSNTNSEIAVEIETSPKDFSMIKTILLSLVGIIGVVFGGDLVVSSASNIAKSFGMSGNLIGLTIVAVGTSLPELVTSAMATKKGETEIAIGNVIGSNVFNILLILGLSSAISPISISLISIIDIIFMIFISIILFLFMKNQSNLEKKNGYIFIGIYILYLLYTIIR